MLPICILTIQDEDDRAYMSRLFVQYHRLMYQCTYEVLDDKWATEDAVQTTLLRLIGPGKRPGLCSGRSWRKCDKRGRILC